MAGESDPMRVDVAARWSTLRSRVSMGPCDLVCLDEAFRSCPVPEEVFELGFEPSIVRDYSAGDLNERMAAEDNEAIMGAVLDARGIGIGTASITPQTPDEPAGITMVDFTEELGVLIVVTTVQDPHTTDLSGNADAGGRPRRVILHRDRFARIVWVEPDGEALLGHASEAMVDRAASEFIHPEDQDRGIRGWLAMLTGRGDARHRIRWRTADDDWRWVEMTHVNHLEDLGYVETELLDVDDEMAALARARAGEMEFHTLTESLPSGVVRLNTDFEVVYVNRWLRELTGWSDDAGTDAMVESLHADDRTQVIEAIRRTEAGEGADLRVRMTTARGALRNCNVRIRTLALDGEHVGAIASIEDVTESAALQAELRRQAETDALTGVANRVALSDRLEALLAGGSGLALLFFDLDEFKLVNDGLGHDAGDDLLVDVARRVKRLLRPTDLLARVGGDEFVVVCPWATTTTDATTIADRLIAEVQQAYHWSTESTSINCSVGIAVHDGSTAVTPDELISNADLAMYKAKEAGGGRWETYDAGLRTALTQAFDLQRAIVEALRADEFQLHVQPVKELATGHTVALECLLRWFEPSGTPVDTGELIRFAERSGLIVPLGHWVIDQACAIAARAAASGHPDLRVSMNVSGRQLREGGFEQDLSDAIARHGVDPSRLILEVTETVFVGTNGDAVDTLRSIASTGCTIALDDFGTGHSSLNQLRLMPTRMLKVDRSYIADLGTDPGTTAITRALVELCADLDIELVAEGIETADQAELTEALGIRLGQGYHLDRPMPADSFFASRPRGNPTFRPS